ncbi:MAG: prepilin-type N-terminal cleavage/methylation domain-containing protein [Proteobacteria bacterium]|nr:prepilin-type N-terminal cleavage/methylation domain-containing protein [Pseudomonadota bacterium]
MELKSRELFLVLDRKDWGVNMAMRHGFTLIELLVSVFLTSIVVLAAYALVDSSSASLRNEIDNRVMEGNLENAGQIIARDLSRVGYHVPFDSRDGDANRIMGYNNSKLLGIRSINYLGNQQIVGSNKYVAELKLVIDMTDHDGFKVTADANDGKMRLDKRTTSYLTLSDVIEMPNSRDDSFSFPMHVMDETMADAAFRRAFRYAKAVYVKSSKKDERVLIMLNNAGGGYVDGSNAPVPADYVTGDIFYSQTEKLNTATKSLEDYGFGNMGGFMVGERVSPIVSVVYRYNRDTRGFERCYAKSLSSNGGSNYLRSDAALEACSTIVHNIAYFELYPITDVDPLGEQRGSFIKYLDAAKCTSGACANITNIGGMESFNLLQTVDISTVIGFYYRIGSYGDREANWGRTDGVQPSVIEVVDGKTRRLPLVHAQGTVLLKNRISLSGGPVSCTGNNCSLQYN